MIVLFVLACGGDPPADTSASTAAADDATEVSPSAYIYDGAAPETVAPMSAEEMEPAVQEVFDAVLQIDAELVVEGHAASIKLSDKTCPEFLDHNNQVLWYEFCETAEGAVFRGYSLSATLFGLVLEDVYHERWMWYTARMWVQDLKGQVFQLWGDSLIEETVGEDGSQERFVLLDGDFRWDDPMADGTWMQDDLSIWLYTLESQFASHREHWFDGSVSRLKGDLVAVQFQDVLFSTAEDGCETEPAGTISVWDWHGNRYDIAYDETCDGCGEAVLDDGTVVGTVCTDFSETMGWKAVPW